MDKGKNGQVSSESPRRALLTTGLLPLFILAMGLLGCGPVGQPDSNVVHLPLPGLKADGLATVEIDSQKFDGQDKLVHAIFSNPYQAIGFELKISEPSRIKLEKFRATPGMLNQISIWGPRQATGKTSEEEITYGDVPVISAKEKKSDDGWRSLFGGDQDTGIDDVMLLEGSYLVVVNTTGDFDPRVKDFDGKCPIVLYCLAGGCQGETLPACLPDKYETSAVRPDNNSCQNASQITGKDPQCDFGICAIYDIRANTHDRADEDFYVIDMLDPWQFTFGFEAELMNIPDGQEFDLYLYKGLDNCENDLFIGSSLMNNSTQHEEIRFEGKAGVDDSGLYYFRVVPRVSQPCSDAYQFIISGV